MRKSQRILAVAMTILLLIPMAGCANPEPGESQDVIEKEENTDIVLKEENTTVKEGNAMAIYTAEYPEMAQYPETNGFDYDEEQYMAWRESRSALQSASKEYKEGIREYTIETMQEFLSDTNGENRVYSPLNVYMALAMLAETTEGESRDQILDLLHTDSVEVLREKVKTLWNANYCDDGTVTSLLAASLWLDQEITYRAETLKTLAENYYASSFQGSMGSVEYNQMLRDWLNEQTGGLLKEQVSDVEMNPETVLALATTVYFRAKWGNEFSEKNTETGVFHAADGDVECDFMHQSRSGSYYWGDKFSAVVRNLENSGNMMFLLPDEGVDVEELLTDDEAMNFLFDYGNWENQKRLIVNQSIPKFDAVSDFSLVDGLKNLGVTSVFDARLSDFTPLTAEIPVEVTEATHAARVMIDEEGCIAAAYTVMLATGSAMPPKEEVDFILDRPFLFVINGQDGQPLFIGIVNTPK